MKKFLKYAFFTALFIALSMGSGFYYVARSLSDDNTPNFVGDVPPKTDELVKGGRQNILLLGLDEGTIGASEDNNRHRSDTMMLFTIDGKNKSIKALSIPRDTRITLGRFGTQKINAAMAYGGVDLAVETVRDFLKVPIHNYVVVNLKGFREIVDAVGGVEINIEKPMVYRDRAGGLDINIQPGLQILDGKKAEEYIRFRDYPQADLGRIEAQQKFIKALAKTLLKPQTLLKLPKIIDVVQNNVNTDIAPMEMASLANLARQITSSDIKTYTLPGEGKYIANTSYFIPYQNEMNELIDEIFFSDDDHIKVAVLNGNGAVGVASKIAQKLEEEGFKVVEIANADNFDYETTTIIYPKEKKDDAEKVAKVFSSAKIEETEDKAKLTTIIVGKDAY